MLFNFQLKRPLECLLPKGENEGDKYVCWFYLTDSYYYIDLCGVKLFESSPQWIEKYTDHDLPDNRFVDYQYSRQLEDLFEILPVIACPMPSSLYSLIETEEKRVLLSDRIMDIWDTKSPMGWNEEDEIYDNIVSNLIYYGHLDSGYLRFRSQCQFINVDGDVIIRYNFIDKDEDGCPVWSAGKGCYTIKYTEFIHEIEDLLDRFFTAMDKQVETAMQVFTKRELEKSNIMMENAQRKNYFHSILNSMKNKEYENRIDWQKLRTDLESCLSQPTL